MIYVFKKDEEREESVESFRVKPLALRKRTYIYAFNSNKLFKVNVFIYTYLINLIFCLTDQLLVLLLPTRVLGLLNQ